MLLALIGLLLAGTAAALAARAVAMPHMKAAETVARIDAYGYARGHMADEPARGGVRSAFDDIAGALGALVAGRFGAEREEELRVQLMMAGVYSLSPRRFMGYQALCAVSVPVTWLGLASQGAIPGGIAILGVPVVAVIGWYGPRLVLQKRAQRRFQEIDRNLPDLIDLLIVTVEAGLGFTGSLRLASQRLHGPVGDELRLALQEQSMGLSTNEALQNMQVRCRTPAVRTFVRSIRQGETLGVSTGQIMRNLAAEMRSRRRQAAEARAQKAPTKMLFPLIFLIFPAMFLILLGPAVFTLLTSFGD